MTFRLVLVTDRLRLAKACGDGNPRALLLRQIAAAVEAELDVVQIRERDLDARALVALVREAAKCTRGTRTKLLVNDRVDVAACVDDVGVHLRAEGLAPAAARRLLPAPRDIMRSVHGLHEVPAAAGADALLAGTVFATASKPGQTTLLGTDGLVAVVAAAGQVPVVAIGGITIANVAEVQRAGASGLASIGAFLPSVGQDPREAVLTAAHRLRDLSG